MFHVKQSGAGRVNNMVEDMRCVIAARPEGKKLLSRFRTLEKELKKTADALLQAWREEDADL